MKPNATDELRQTLRRNGLEGWRLTTQPDGIAVSDATGRHICLVCPAPGGKHVARARVSQSGGIATVLETPARNNPGAALQEWLNTIEEYRNRTRRRPRQNRTPG